MGTDLLNLIKSMKYGRNPKQPLKFKEYLRLRKLVTEAYFRTVDLMNGIKWN